MVHHGKKKTVIINYKARDTILEEAVNLLMRDSRLNKEVTKGKKLSWREIMEILEKKHRKRFYETIEQIIKSNQGKKIRKQFKSKIKIERTKREKSKILVKLPKHLRSSKALKDILTHKFCTQKKKNKKLENINLQNQKLLW